MTSDELNELLNLLQRRRSETPPVEAKRAKSSLPKKLWETLSAFSNTPGAGGGVILLGVDEESNFEAVGVDDVAKLQADLASMCDLMEPIIRPVIQVFEVAGKTILVAEVPELAPEQKPCYYKGVGMHTGSFLRVGDGDRRLTSYEIQAMLEARTQPRYDREPVEGATLADLSPELYAPLLKQVRQRRAGMDAHWTDERLLQSLGILVSDAGGVLRPSLAGWISLAPWPQERFPNLCVTFMRHPTPRLGEPGPAGERFLDNEKIEGPLPGMVVRALAVLKRNMQRRGIVQGLFREDMWEYPELVLREAIVNALGHRDLSPAARGAQVQIHMFPDRLEVVNPGGLFGPIVPEQLGEPGVQSARNETLMRLLEDLPPPGESRALCDNRGSGLSSMLHVLRQSGMAPASFDADLTHFRLIVPNHSLYAPTTLESVERLVAGRSVSKAQRQALAYLHHVPHLSNSDYCRLTGADSRVSTRDLADLVNLGLVRREGERRWATYELAQPSESSSALRPASGSSTVRPAEMATPVKPVRRNEPKLQMVEAALRAHGELSVLELSNQLGASRMTLFSWIRTLCEEGRVEPTYENPRHPKMRYRLKPKA